MNFPNNRKQHKPASMCITSGIPFNKVLNKRTIPIPPAAIKEGRLPVER